ncbi:MAG: 30S ribosomal protein S6e [Fervidicoccaceae archaeon]
MPEFKLIVSDRFQSTQKIKVKVIGDEKIPLSKEQKEGRRLPTCEISKALAEKLNIEDGVLALRLVKEGSKEVKMHLKPVIKEGIEENTVKVPQDLLAEKVGELEAEGEAFRSRAFQLTLDEPTSRRLVGMKIGDEIDATIIGLNGKLVIRGGSDNSGFPMRADVPGTVKKKLLLSGPPGYHPRNRGERRRKIVRGNTIDDSIVQINVVLVREKEAKER